MTAVLITDIEFDTTDDGFGDLSDTERDALVRGEISSVYEIDGDMGALGRDEFEHLICEEISSETGWLVSRFAYTVIESEFV